MTAKFIVLGAGGHARVLFDALKSSGCEIMGCLDAKPALKGKIVDGVRILGGDELLKEHAPGAVNLANGVGGANSTAARRAIFEKLVALGHSFPPVKSGSCHCSQSVELGDGCQILTHSVVHPGARIGANTVVNTSAIVEHDCVVGAHAFIGPGAILCGGARLADEVFVGAGAVILPGIQIGAGSHIGAGAVVHKDVPAGAKARGARLIRERV